MKVNKILWGGPKSSVEALHHVHPCWLEKNDTPPSGTNALQASELSNYARADARRHDLNERKKLKLNLLSKTPAQKRRGARSSIIPNESTDVLYMHIVL